MLLKWRNDLSTNLFIEDYPSCSIETIRAQLTELKAQNQLPSIVVIDNINRIAVEGDPTPESDDYGVIPLYASLIRIASKEFQLTLD